MNYRKNALETMRTTHTMDKDEVIAACKFYIQQGPDFAFNSPLQVAIDDGRVDIDVKGTPNSNGALGHLAVTFTYEQKIT